MSSLQEPAKIIRVEVCFGASVASLKSESEPEEVGEFDQEYWLTYEDGSRRRIHPNEFDPTAGDSPEFTHDVFELLSELARRAKHHTFKSRGQNS